MDAIDDPVLSIRLRQRVAFFRTYYEPIAANSRHGLAVVDPASCAVLFANARFLASHGLPPHTPVPFSCASVYGGAHCRGDKSRCPAAEACDVSRERRRRETRSAGGGLPDRTTEVIAIPLLERGDLGRQSEILVIEKEDESGPAGESDVEQQREHLAAITSYSGDAIIGLDGDHRVRSWNRGAEETFGYKAEETIGRDFSFLVPDDDAARREYRQVLDEFARKGILKNYQARCIAKDGRAVIVNCTRSLVLDRAGNPRGVALICRDVTMEERLRELIDHQFRAMSVTHEIGDLLHSTRSVEEILQLILIGVTAGQGLGFNRAFLLLVDERDGVARLRGRMAIGPSNADEASRIWNSLAQEHLSLQELYQRYLADRGTADETVQRIVAAIDVPLSNEDHALVRALRERRAANVQGGRVVGDDVAVDPDLCRQLQSDSFAVVPLNTRERAIGLLLVDNRITGVPVSDADLQMLKVFANHAGIALENSQLRANLERRLDELAQLNRALQAQQSRLMQAERHSVIGEMAARVVHEVRNPLVSIGGFARLVRRGFAADDPRSDYLRIISDEVARLERIVKELLDFSRPQSRLDLKQLDLNRLVHELVAMATVEAEAHGVVVSESYDDSIGAVTIDGDKIRQVLLNIIRNALDVMLDRGRLAIATKGVEGNRFTVSIEDTGPGIPAERREQVFEPGFTTRQDGTGFGLAIAKRLVELQGGQICLRETVPHGCTFEIVMPRRVDLEERGHESRAGETDADPHRG